MNKSIFRPRNHGGLPRSRHQIATRILLIAALLLNNAALAGTFEPVTEFGSNPGNLRMFKYLPDSLRSPAPLVVALHGCRQSASAYDNETGWTTLADRWGFALLLPEQKGPPVLQPPLQPSSGFPLPTLEYGFTLPLLDVNNWLACFNWFEPGDIGRDQGEAASIKQMIDRMKTDHAIDPKRIFVTGLSAGGAMTAVMLATYPEVFAGGAIIAGLPYKCAISAGEAFSCMNPGKNLSPSEWGSRVRAATNHTGPWPRVSIWQGSSDFTVNPANATELLEQWTDVHSIDLVPEVNDTVQSYPHRLYKDTQGNALVETFSITGMGHGTPVDPGPGEAQCGVAAPFILDANICSSLHIAKFWGLD
jgi:poly(hydroxyalkanoate) depolymerase family esterase